MEKHPAGAGMAPVDITEQTATTELLSYERNLYKDLVASLPVGVYRLRVKAAREWVNHEWVAKLGTNYSIEMASNAFCRILGVTQAQREANAQIVAERIHPDDRPDFIAKNVAALNSPDTFRWDGRILKGNEVRWVHFISVPRLLSNGDMLWTGILQDTTESRLAAEALRESEARYRGLFEQAGDSIVVYDQKTTAFLDFNDIACRQMGYTREEFSNLTVIDIEAAEKPSEVMRHVRHIVAKGDPVFETKLKTKSGKVLDVEIRPKAIVINGRTVIQAIWHDITSRKQIGKLLQTSEENLAALFNGSVEPIMLLDANAIVLNANPAMCKRLGIAAKDYIGSPAFSVLPHALAKFRLAKFKKTVATGAIQRFEDERNGRFIETHMSPIMGPSGKVVRVAVFGYDITDRVQTESILRKSRDELEVKVKERTARLQTLAVELTQAEHRERQRIAHILHEDLQQRLVGIQCKIHSLREAGSDGSISGTVDWTLKELAETIRLTRNLATHIAPPVLSALGLRTALEWLAEEAQAKYNLDVRLSGCRTFKLPSDGLQAFAFDAIRELLLNVCKHAGVGCAELKLRNVGKHALAIEVHDNGKGGASIHDHQSSFGLLSIRERACALGVGFTVDSPPGEGTCITLILPTL
jgi:PAS domain S-box-containing protein